MYFGGYTSKKQPVGKHALAESSRTMHGLATRIAANSPYLQFLRVTTRMMSDLYGRGALRSLPEEFNLAVNMTSHDALNAEFWRTYCIQEFRGSAFLRELEKELHGAALQRPVNKVLPVRRPGDEDKNACPLSMVALYGWRGTDPRVYYLSPWEFHMRWRPVHLEPPHL